MMSKPQQNILEKQSSTKLMKVATMSDQGEYLIFGFFILPFKQVNRSLHGMSDGIQNTLQVKDVFLKK